MGDVSDLGECYPSLLSFPGRLFQQSRSNAASLDEFKYKIGREPVRSIGSEQSMPLKFAPECGCSGFDSDSMLPMKRMSPVECWGKSRVDQPMSGGAAARTQPSPSACTSGPPLA